MFYGWYFTLSEPNILPYLNVLTFFNTQNLWFIDGHHCLQSVFYSTKILVNLRQEHMFYLRENVRGGDCQYVHVTLWRHHGKYSYEKSSILCKTFRLSTAAHLGVPSRRILHMYTLVSKTHLKYALLWKNWTNQHNRIHEAAEHQRSIYCTDAAWVQRFSPLTARIIKPAGIACAEIE